MGENQVKNINEVEELRGLGWLENRVEPISVAEDKYITIYGTQLRDGQYGQYALMEVAIDGSSERIWLRSGAQAVVRKMTVAADLGLFPLRGRVIRIGRTWDIV